MTAAPYSRRDFLAATGAALAAAACAPAVRTPSRREYDLIIRGGMVFDGTGIAATESDVGIVGGRVAAIAPSLRDSARLVLDARGLAVAPGFIDIHSHADGLLLQDPRAESVIRQGVTTAVVGQDGSSRGVTAGDDDVPSARAVQPVARRPRSLTEFFDAVDALPSAINIASMVGLGSVRGAVVGDADRPATASEIARMQGVVRAALEQGACGASSGLEYTPGGFASLAELTALCQPLAARGLPYATHMRNEDDRLLEAVDEAIAVATGAGCPLQISHLKTQGPRNWGKIDDVLARVDGAKARGLNIAFDRYPYIAYQTGLSNLFPASSRDGGTAAFLARLADPAQAPALRTYAMAKVEGIGGWDNVMISGVRDPGDKKAEGARLGTYAASLGADPYDTAVALLTRNRGDVGMVGFAMSEDNIARFLAHPLGMVCSDGGAFAVDGPARSGHPHPRGLGTFARVLGYYVRERKVLTLPQAIYKMSGFPASRLTLADRGQLKPGFAADVVVFDPATVRDRATFTEPFQYAEGVRDVVVNGVVAVRDGAHGEARSGRALRLPRSGR